MTISINKWYKLISLSFFYLNNCTKLLSSYKLDKYCEVPEIIWLKPHNI